MIRAIPPCMLYTLIIHSWIPPLIFVVAANPLHYIIGGFFWCSRQRYCLFHSPHLRWGIKIRFHLRRNSNLFENFVKKILFLLWLQMALMRLNKTNIHLAAFRAVSVVKKPPTEILNLSEMW